MNNRFSTLLLLLLALLTCLVVVVTLSNFVHRHEAPAASTDQLRNDQSAR